MSGQVQVVRLNYEPRKAFVAFHQRTKRRAVVVAHRRFGKTYGLLQDLVGRALNFRKTDKKGKPFKNARYAYICPLKNQAKDVAWQYLLDFTAELPGLKRNESELWVEFTCASGERARIRLYGADDPNALRGLYFDGVVLDE